MVDYLLSNEPEFAKDFVTIGQRGIVYDLAQILVQVPASVRWTVLDFVWDWASRDPARAWASEICDRFLAAGLAQDSG
ncbi:MAG: hypothetical protein GEU80_11910 [Dehalococcoidia bacterium]|nr:hypothetical protein [Dehalococcoidia bacterium]